LSVEEPEDDDFEEPLEDELPLLDEFEELDEPVEDPR